MDLIIGIERLTALGFIIIGLSHMTAPRAWARFFIDMRERGEVAGLYNAFVHIPLGLLIVAFHPVWTWPGIVVTLIGWALTLKGTLHFLWPSLTQRTTGHIADEKAGLFRFAGIVSLAIGLFVGWIALCAR
jgi:uncharacterized protein YjeT (DUF2065 family)